MHLNEKIVAQWIRQKTNKEISPQKLNKKKRSLTTKPSQLILRKVFQLIKEHHQLVVKKSKKLRNSVSKIRWEIKNLKRAKVQSLK